MVMVKAQFRNLPNVLIFFLCNAKSKRALIGQNLNIDSLSLPKGCFSLVFGIRMMLCTFNNNNLASFLMIMDDNSKPLTECVVLDSVFYINGSGKWLFFI